MEENSVPTTHLIQETTKRNKKKRVATPSFDAVTKAVPVGLIGLIGKEVSISQ